MRQSSSSGVVTDQDRIKATMGLCVVKTALDRREEHKQSEKGFTGGLHK